jgi:hypothetical protein
MAILLNDNLNVVAAKPVDYRYGPHTDTAAALTAIPLYQRYKGLVVGIIENETLVEYWFNLGVADEDLELKTLLPSTYSDKRTLISAGSNLNSNKYYIVNSSGGPLTVVLPSSPITGDFIWLQDAAGTWGTNAVTVDRNGKKILGIEDSLSLNVSDKVTLLTYVGGVIGWDVKELTGDSVVGSTGLIGYIGATGPAGPSGASGPSGLSAYQSAVAQGFLGSEYDWLHTLPVPLKEQVYIASTEVTAPESSPFNINVKAYQAYLFLQGFGQDFSVNFRGDNTTSLNSLLSTGEAITCALTVVNQANPVKLYKLFVDGVEVSLTYNYLGIDASAYEVGSYAIYLVKTGNNQFFVTVNQSPLQPTSIP